MQHNKTCKTVLLCAGFITMSHAPYALSSPASAVTANSDEAIERIEVTGRVNNFLNESNIDLSQSSSPDLRDQLRLLPGISINSNGNISGIVQYRGLFGERLRINVDGAPVIGAGPNGMDPPLSHAVASLYQTITLYQGLAPVSVGAETIGGAIDIDEYDFAINPDPQWQTQGGITASYNHNNNNSISGLLFASSDNRYIVINGDRQEGDNYSSGDGIEVPSTFFERSSVKLRGGFENGRHRLDFTVAKRDTAESGTPSLAMDILFVDAFWYRVNYQLELNNSWRISTRVFGNQNEHDMNNFSLRTPPMPPMFRLNQTKADASGLQAGATYSNNNLDIEFGLESSNRRHHSLISNPNNPDFFLRNFNRAQRDLFSSFVEVTKQNTLFNWQLGLRASEVSTSANEVATNMAMMNPNARALQENFNSADRDLSFSLLDLVLKTRFSLSEQVSIVASAGIKERAPSYNELYSWFPLGVSAGLADGRNYLGNLDLNKEHAQKIDIGIEYRQAGMVLSGNVFYSDIDDYILGLPSTVQAANNIAMMNNIPAPLTWSNVDATLSGIEATLRYQLNDSWQLNAQAEYVRGKQTTPVKQDLYRVAPFNANLSVQYTKDNWEWHLIGDISAAQHKVAEQQNETPTAGYGIFNSKFVYMFDQGVKLSLLAENILDKDYSQHLGGINRVNDPNLARGEKVPAIGRNIGVYVSYEF